MKNGLSKDFLLDAARHGLVPSEVERQFHRLLTASETASPEFPCTLMAGIRRFAADELAEMAEVGTQLPVHRAIRFIPASGAATRMFNAIVNREPTAMAQLDEHWASFPFRKAAEAKANCDTLEERWVAVVDVLGLPDLPKGALDFHVENGQTRTAFDGQLIEWARTLSAEGGRIHFTLPARVFETQLLGIQSAAKIYGLSVDASVQDASTDTIAVTEDNRPFLKSDGSPLFRPGGHGSLLHNLAAIGQANPGALVSIKNIDNVRPESALGEVLPWRRALLGLAETMDRQRIQALKALEKGDVVPAQDWLVQGPLHPLDKPPAAAGDLREALDRPFLVAGMVRNEGEPGGGPFWLRDDQGTLRSQVVERAEMDLTHPAVLECLSKATHFNPVDLVCSLHDQFGSPYDLLAFVDARRDFVVSKTHEGIPLKALEHPGLWNGAMGRWNTVFVEVHSATFAPVKTAFDLLRPSHQPTA